MSDQDIEDLRNWLEGAGLGNLFENFRSQECFLNDILEIDYKEYAMDLGLTTVGLKQKFKKAQQALILQRAKQSDIDLEESKQVAFDATVVPTRSGRISPMGVVDLSPPFLLGEDVQSVSAPSHGTKISGREISSESTFTLEPPANVNYNDICRNLIYDTGRELAVGMLDCLYTTCFTSRPIDTVCIQHWIDAFYHRETSVLAQSDEDHGNAIQAANQSINDALATEFWLPLRYACLWNYTYSFPSVMFSLEYLALDDIIKAIRREGKALAEVHPKLPEIESRLPTFFRKAWDGDNLHRLSVVISTYGKQKHATIPCNAKYGCMSLYGNGICGLSHYITPENTVKLSTWSKYERSFDMKLWDPSLLFPLINNWPRVESNWSESHHPFLLLSRAATDASALEDTVTSSSAFQSYFLRNSSYLFQTNPKEFLVLLENANGSIGSISKHRESIFQVVKKLSTCRNDGIGHKHDSYDLPDVWWISKHVVNCAYAFKQQTETVNSWPGKAPDQITIKKLNEIANTCLNKIINDTRQVLRPHVHHGISPEVEYETFLKAVNHMKPDGPFLLLVLPPLQERVIPTSLAGVNWDAVIDFTVTLDPTQTGILSPGWKVFSDAIREKRVRSRWVHMDERYLMNGHLGNFRDLLDNVGSGMPWWQPIEERVSRLTLFDEKGREKNGASTELNLIEGNISNFARLVEERVVNRKLHIVIPFYGEYQAVFTSTEGNPYFGIENPNFLFPVVLKHLLRELTSNIRTVSSCCYLLQEPTLALDHLENNENFIRKDRTMKGELVKILLSKDILDTRYKFSHMITNRENSQIIFVYNGDIQPFIGSHVDGLDEVELIDETRKNHQVLMNCGMEVLHTQSGRDSLAEIHDISQFSKFLSTLSSRNEANIPSDQVLAALAFFHHSPAPWALFCKNIMSLDNQLDFDIVISRKAEVRAIAEKADYLRKSFDRTVLVIRYKSKQGATTLVREFAWKYAFQKWKSVVIWLTERFNNVDEYGTEKSMAILQAFFAGQQQKSLVIIADRHISDNMLKKLCVKLVAWKIPYLLIRLERDVGVLEEGHFLGKERGVQKHAVMTIDSPTDSIVQEVQKSIVKLASLFDSSIDRYTDLSKLLERKDQQYFKKLMFLRVVDFSRSATEMQRGNTPHQPTERAKVFDHLYTAIVTKWMEDVLNKLFLRVQQEMQTSNQSITLAELRCLYYLAIVQLCLPNSTGIQINSFAVVMNDPNSFKWLFAAWKENGIEKRLLQASYVRMAQEKIAKLYNSQATAVLGSLLPYTEMLELNEVCPMPLTPNEDDPIAAISTATASGLELETDIVNERNPPSVQFEFWSKFQNLMEDSLTGLCSTTAARRAKMPSTQITNLPYPNELFSSLKADMHTPPADTQDGIMDDIAGMMWTEFLQESSSRIRFLTDDIAYLFLKMALQRENLHCPYPGDSSNLEASMIYVVAMSLLHTINFDPSCRHQLMKLSDVDSFNISLHDKENYTLAWNAQHILIQRKYTITKHEETSSLIASWDGTSNSRKWSWVLKSIHSANEQNQEGIQSLSMMQGRRLFSGYETKLLLGSMAVYFGNWRVSTVIASSLMQYQTWKLTNNLTEMQSDNRLLFMPNLWNDVYVASRKAFDDGTVIFFFSFGRLLVAFDEIRRKTNGTSPSAMVQDYKKFAGTLEKLGQCIRYYMLLVRKIFLVSLHEAIQRVKSDLPVVQQTQAVVDIVGSFASRSLAFLTALANIARRFYRLNLQVTWRDRQVQPVIYGEEINCWLSVLEYQKEINNEIEKAFPHVTHTVPVDIETNLTQTFISEIYETFYDVSKLHNFDLTGGRNVNGDNTNRALLSNLLNINNSIISDMVTSEDALDECHYLLDDISSCMTTETQDNYFAANWDKEESFIIRLMRVEAEQNEDGSMMLWSEGFEAIYAKLQSKQNDPTTPERVIAMYQRRLARFAFCMWQYVPKPVASTSEAEKQANWHAQQQHLQYKFMTSPAQERNIGLVVHSIISCMKELKYPRRLMMQLFEAVSCLSPHYVDQQTSFEFCPYRLHFLQNIMLEWSHFAEMEFHQRTMDVVSYATMKRFQCMLSFISLWANTARRLAPGITVDNPGVVNNKDVEILRWENGYFDAKDNKWRSGHLPERYREQVKHLDRYVLIPPHKDYLQHGYQAWFSRDRAEAVSPPLCIRKQFLRSVDEQDEDAFPRQVVYGKCIYLKEESNVYFGVVQLENSSVQLPFHIDPKAKWQNLVRHNVQPAVNQECSFHVVFLPWEVQAYAVQFHSLGVNNGQRIKEKLLSSHSNYKRDLDHTSDHSSDNRWNLTMTHTPLPEVATVRHMIELTYEEDDYYPLTSSALEELVTFTAGKGTLLHCLLPHQFYKVVDHATASVDIHAEPKIGQMLYGHVSRGGDLITPYMDRPPKSNCGLVAFNLTDILSNMQSDKERMLVTDLFEKEHGFLTPLWHDVCNLLYPTRPTNAIRTQMNCTPRPVDQNSTRTVDTTKLPNMYFLVSFPFFGFAAAREGLLVLVASTEENAFSAHQGGDKRLDLALLMFSRSLLARQVCEIVKTLSNGVHRIVNNHGIAALSTLQVCEPHFHRLTTSSKETAVDSHSLKDSATAKSKGTITKPKPSSNPASLSSKKAPTKPTVSSQPIAINLKKPPTKPTPQPLPSGGSTTPAASVSLVDKKDPAQPAPRPTGPTPVPSGGSTTPAASVSLVDKKDPAQPAPRPTGPSPLPSGGSTPAASVTIPSVASTSTAPTGQPSSWSKALRTTPAPPSLPQQAVAAPSVATARDVIEHTEYQNSDTDDDDDGFITAVTKSTKKNTKASTTKPTQAIPTNPVNVQPDTVENDSPTGTVCQYHFHCKNGLQCGNSHSPLERYLFQFFMDRDEDNKRLTYRYANCRNDSCPFGLECRFKHPTHPNHTLFCVNCFEEGHIKDDCPVEDDSPTGPTCPFHFNCQHGLQCPQPHTPLEKSLFRFFKEKNQEHKRLTYRYILCRNDRCTFGLKCRFKHPTHPKKALFCVNCFEEGHIKDDCSQPKQFRK